MTDFIQHKHVGLLLGSLMRIQLCMQLGQLLQLIEIDIEKSYFK